MKLVISTFVFLLSLNLFAADKNTAVFETNFGAIEIKLYEKEAPISVANFKSYIKSGFYKGTIFHRVIDNFMVQGGDPLGQGYGGESAWGGKFNDEIDTSSPLYQGAYLKGTVAMANSGPNTNGSQFFIMHSDYPLPPSYTKFGNVIEGQDVVDAIGNVDTNASDKPLEDVIMEKVYIEDQR